MSEQLSFLRDLGTKVASLPENSEFASDLRLCVSCNYHKPLDEFYTRIRAKKRQRHGSRCKPCERIRDKKYNRTNRIRMRQRYPNKKRSDTLWEKFSLTVDEYDKMLENQQGKCAICRCDRKIQKRNFAVDHCHATGKIRGILCGNCNAGLGFFKDNPQSLTNALTYLISSGI